MNIRDVQLWYARLLEVAEMLKLLTAIDISDRRALAKAPRGKP
jgi:hypothetical protein